MEQTAFKDISITGGFWQQRQRLNREVTTPEVYRQFTRTGRFKALDFEWREGDGDKPHFFWDSDIAKWIESAAYLLMKSPDKALEDSVDALIDKIEQHQFADGYFNIYYTVCEPGKRFTNRMNHELYCAGHLIEAAVAYSEATGKDKLLNCMKRYVELIERVFIKEDSAAFCTPGHEEIELALVKLFKHTGEEKYLALSRAFIDKRGTCQKDFDSPFLISHAYDQSERPVREMRTAQGHSVRAAYLYSAMADHALLSGDSELLTACRELFKSIVKRRMYITGGIGSSIIGEAFSEDYDLPNSLAYAETCAAIGLALFARRMSLLEPDSLYADAAERAIYNGVLAGNSLDGKGFFYENPLEININERRRIINHRNEDQHLPVSQRAAVFGCSCCPPNFTRFIASIGDFLYTCDENAVYIHHYMESEAKVGEITLTQKTQYPFDGEIELTVKNAGSKTVALRVPGWCASYSVSCNGEKIKTAPVKGYIYLPLSTDSAVITAVFDMEPQLIEANPNIENNCGRVALMRGPVVYCLESGDNPVPLRSLTVNRSLNAAVSLDEQLGCPVIEADGAVRQAFDGLYRPLTDERSPVRLRFIPYYAFANRGERDMLVFVGV